MRKIMLGSDWWTDCDDAVALRLLLRAHKNEEIELCAIALNACMEKSVASLDAFLLLEGNLDFPIGIDHTATEFSGTPTYQKGLSGHATRRAKNADAEDACRLYRKILSESDEPIEIVEIGFLQVIEALLKSGADDISSKTGLELVKEKVKKFWVMAGKWDEDGGEEHNFALTNVSRRAGSYFCQFCPVPVTFLGWEIGHSVITGQTISHDDFLYQVLLDHGSPNGRSSWDPMLVLAAVIGDEKEAGYETIPGTARVCEETGKNYFLRDESGLHCYLKKKHEDSFYEKAINTRIE